MINSSQEIMAKIEHLFSLCIALAATLLQVQFQFNDSFWLKLVVFFGSVSYLAKAVKNEKMSTRDAFFTALSGYTFGVYTAPALSDYLEVVKPSYTFAIHYLSGAFGMWILNIGWTIMQGAQDDIYPMLKSVAKSWLPKKPKTTSKP